MFEKTQKLETYDSGESNLNLSFNTIIFYQYTTQLLMYLYNMLSFNINIL